MKLKDDSKKYSPILGMIFILAGFTLIFFQYIFIYNINDNDIEKYISQRITKVTEDLDVNAVVIDKLRTEYGLVVLFHTNVDKNPIGYAVFEKDAIFNRYDNEDFALYDNRIDYNGDMDALIDLNSGNVFQFVDDEIILINSQYNNKALIEYYLSIIIGIIAIAYGLVIQLRVQGMISKHDENS